MRNVLRFLHQEGLQLAILASPYLLAAALWNKLPAQIVTHRDIHSRPDGWMPKAEGLLVPPAINLLVTTFFALAPRLGLLLGQRSLTSTPSQRRLWQAARLGVSAFTSLICMVAAAAAAGWRLDVGRACSMAGLVLLAFVGNLLSSLEPNYLMGIRTPWTLEDPATWRATHRLGSRVMFFGSLAFLVVGLFVPGTVLLGLFLAFATLLTLGGIGYSAWFYQKRFAR